MLPRFITHHLSLIVSVFVPNGLLAAFAFALLFAACNGDSDKPAVSTTPPKPARTPVQTPTFVADSAYLFVKKQVDFGPRVPGSAAHKKCAAWLAAEFRRFGLTVVEQKFQAKTYFGSLEAVNIIGQYRPELPDRVLLCAHWDSRHIADKDAKDKNKPILGADDGGSGVGVLLEIARALQTNPVPMGIDFVLFDAEDLGDDRDETAGDSPLKQATQESKAETWCLGSQHWAANPHKPGYTARFGILLDMVGAKGAQFPREGYSMVNALPVQDKIWGIASELGFSGLFLNRDGGGITDDHLFVMRGRQIPTVDIIGMPNPSPHVFGAHHHTHNDNMSVIDREVLRAVGQVVLETVYRTYNQG